MAIDPQGALRASNRGPSPSTESYDWLANASLWLAAAGAGQMAIGAWASAQSARHLAKSEAQDLEYAASVSDQNARRAEIEAQAIQKAGEREIGMQTAQYGQLKGAAEVDLAASGVQAGVGNAAEVMASIELAKQEDSSAINRNTVRAAYQRRLEAQGLRNQGSLQRVSAGNVRRSGRSVSSGSAAATSLIGSGARIAGLAQSYYGRG